MFHLVGDNLCVQKSDKKNMSKAWMLLLLSIFNIDLELALDGNVDMGRNFTRITSCC